MAFYELRQYKVRPGKMQEWLKVMEEEIIPFQVAKGMVITGSFRGEADESVYVWLRRFESEAQRAGERHLDFAARQIEHAGDPAAAARLAADDAFEPRQGLGLGDKDAQPSRRLRDDRVERLDLLHREPQAFILAPYIDRDDQRLTSFQETARLRQGFREHRDLEGPRCVRQLHKSKAVAARRSALLFANDDAAQAEAAGAVRGKRRRQVDPAQNAGALQTLGVGVERVTR